jgi:DNA-binding GntR family transcriptional regulator
MASFDSPGRADSALPLHRTRMADLAYERIRELIIVGELPIGARLIETQLAQDFGTSRAPVREAIRRLVEDGLIEERPHHGATVKVLDAAAIIDLYNVRLALETMTIRLATLRGMPVDRLGELIALMEQAGRNGDTMLVARYELDFHAEVCQHSGNQLAIELFRSLGGRLLMAVALDNTAQQDLLGVGAEHEPLLAAIESGDDRRAAEEMRLHILSTVGDLLARLGGDPLDLLDYPRRS